MAASFSVSFLQFGLIGYPVEHSLSPILHRAALQEFGLRGDYTLFPVAPNDNSGLKHLLAQMRQGEIHGLNVTIPYKQRIIPLLDEITTTAQAIGAVNTIAQQGGRLIGYNTDAEGFWADLQTFGMDTPGTALVLGAGGAARAVVFALQQQGWEIWVAARRIEQAQELLTQLAPQGRSLHLSALEKEDLSSVRLIVNATPAGMPPHSDHSPWPARAAFPPQAKVYDLIYNPRETKWMQAARTAGLPVRNGLGMLVEQAARAFEIWTGFRPSRPKLLKALAEQAGSV